jgi:hypothetical protein
VPRWTPHSTAWRRHERPRRAAQLLDIEAIKQLDARDFRLMDLKQWDEWGKVFTADCVTEVPEADLVNTGRAEIVSNVSGALVGARTCHHGHMPEIEIAGDGSARGIWAMFDYVEWAEQDGLRVDSLGAVPDLPS